jgi:hypothetical protein
MSKQTGPYSSDGTTLGALARAIGNLVQTDGDHYTGIPALTLHRRSGPTEPLHCIYNLGLGVVAQGDKQVLLGDESTMVRGNRCSRRSISLSSRMSRGPVVQNRFLG